jgi:hypothetical protein
MTDNWDRHFRNVTNKTKQRWKVQLRDGKTNETLEIVHLGQQTLRRV